MLIKQHDKMRDDNNPCLGDHRQLLSKSGSEDTILRGSTFNKANSNKSCR